MADLDVAVHPLPKVADGVVLVLSGAVDAGTAQTFRSKMEELAASGKHFFLLDCAKVTTINSTGFGVLVTLAETVGHDAGALAVCRPTKQVQMLIDMLGLQEVLRVRSDAGAAVEELQRMAGLKTADFGVAAVGTSDSAAAMAVLEREVAALAVATVPAPDAPASPAAAVAPRAVAAVDLPPSAGRMRGRASSVSAPKITIHGYRQLSTRRHHRFDLVLSPERLEDGPPLPVTVVPCFPGALASPPLLPLDLASEPTTVTFWITPLTSGRLTDACFDLWHEGRRLASAPVRAHAVSRRSVWVLLVLAVIAPLAGVIVAQGYPKAIATMREASLFRGLTQAVEKLVGIAPAATGGAETGLALGLAFTLVALVLAGIFALALKPYRRKPVEERLESVRNS